MEKAKRTLLCTDFGNDIAATEVSASYERTCAQNNTEGNIVSHIHDVTPFSLEDAAFHLRQLARSWSWAAPVYIGVIDPGVGTARHPLAVETTAGTFVVPDNGILSLVLEEFEARTAVILDPNIRLTSPEKTATFDGRDLFAPAGALLASGENIRNIGTEISVQELQTVNFHPGKILHVDKFGNLKLFQFEQIFQSIREKLTFFLRKTLSLLEQKNPYFARKVRTFGEAQKGDLVVLPGSSHMIEIGVNLGNAQQSIQACVGDIVEPFPA